MTFYFASYRPTDTGLFFLLLSFVLILALLLLLLFALPSQTPWEGGNNVRRGETPGDRPLRLGPLPQPSTPKAFFSFFSFLYFALLMHTHAYSTGYLGGRSIRLCGSRSTRRGGGGMEGGTDEDDPRTDPMGNNRA
ncbi:hypothetical protein F4809DRAFT_11344 [Biscogniauxia mediterranea]|nr:hypothetical protein F4809DRAFT_11344 [Biscogniauxia mediterranea]